VSSTPAHDDFLKSLAVIPALGILASGSADKTVRLWFALYFSVCRPRQTLLIPLFSTRRDLSTLFVHDLNNISQPTALPQMGSFSGHTRPVDALALDILDSSSSPLLYSADSMGVIKAWSLDISTRPDGSRSVRGTVEAEYGGHRTGVGELWVLQQHIWSGTLSLSCNSRKTMLSYAHDRVLHSFDGLHRHDPVSLSRAHKVPSHNYTFCCRSLSPPTSSYSVVSAISVNGSRGRHHRVEYQLVRRTRCRSRESCRGGRSFA
jgi:WD40 repeat protein